MKRLLSISIDRNMFKEGSAVRERMLELAKDWDEIHVIVAADPSFRATTIGSKVWVYPTRSRIKAFYPLDAIKLGRFIIKGRQITHMTCQDPFLTAMTGISLKNQLNLPLEIQVHTDVGSPHYPYSLGNKIRKALALSYLPKADSIRVVSERIREYLVSKLNISAEKIIVKPIAVNTDAVKNSAVMAIADLHKKYPQFGKIVLMASRLTREKNIKMAVQAWRKVLENIPNAGLVIVGSGPEEGSLRRLITGLGLEKSVLIESWADMPTLISYYKTADMLLLTSLFEGYGLTLVEAHAAGLKIVSTDVGIAREVGATIIGWDPEDAARGITQALGV